MKRVFIAVLDSFGIGYSRDADKFNDRGADTFGHIAQECALGFADVGRKGPLCLPNLTQLGLTKASEEATGRYAAKMPQPDRIIGAYGFASELSSGKDTPSGHWEIAGVPVLFDWGYFTNKINSFPKPLLDKIVERANLPGYLANCHASGTQVLDDFGLEHMQSGKPIFYTSADSVFQIACHEETFGLERLYELCQIVREELNLGDFNIGRVIARPFVGTEIGQFERTGNRRDLAVEPPAATVLEKLISEKSGQVVSIGKIADIYAHKGISKKIKATGIKQLFDETLNEIKLATDNTLVFTNFVDFDANFGHRRNVAGYAAALEYFDSRLPELLALMQKEDILIITADHGCDPIWHGTDHTREYIPVLFYGENIKPGSLGHRDTFADIGQSVADYFSLSPMDYGKSIFK